jgi:CHAT domain-containing protein
MGRYEEAASLLQDYRTWLKQWRAENSPNAAVACNNLALVYQALGRPEEAVSLLEKALTIRTQPWCANALETANSRQNLALLYQQLGRYAEAEGLYRQALAFCQEHLGAAHLLTICTLNNLAGVCQGLGRYAEAEGLYKEALAFCQEHLGTAHPFTANTLRDLAWLYVATGRSEAAGPLYHRALRIREQRLGAIHPFTAQSLHDLAWLYAATGRSEDALHCFQKSTPIENILLARIANAFPETQVYAFSKTLTWHTWDFLTLVWRSFHHDPAIRAAGLDLLLARKAIAYEAAAVHHRTALTDASPALHATCSQLQKRRMDIVQKYFAGPAAQETEAQHEQRLQALDEACTRLEHDLARHVPAFAVQQRLRTADRPAIAQALPAGSMLVEWVRFQPSRFEATAGESLREPARYVAFLLPAGAPDAVQMIDCGEADPIDLWITRFYWEIAGQEPPPEIVEQVRAAGREDPCRRLYDQVFAPLIAALDHHSAPDRTPHFIMAPDGPLCQLSFSALLSPAQRFVIEDYLISYVTVGRDVVQFHASLGGGNGAVIVADPDYNLSRQAPDDEATLSEEPDGDRRHGLTAPAHPGQTALEVFPSLDYAPAEGQAVSQLLHDAGMEIRAEWIGPKAKQALDGPFKALRKPVIVHLATHGFFLPDPATQLRESWRPSLVTPNGARGNIGAFLGTNGIAHNPLLCAGLAFAGVNTVLEGVKPVPEEVEDGVLTALDVLALDMYETELVTLSACQTGQGGILYGEGVVGFRRAFTLVGVRTLVVALWNVPDEETRWLMEEFYTTMLAGQGTLGKAAALRQAQLALLQQLRASEQDDPRLWAGFLCQGDPAPLQTWLGKA